MKIYQTKENMMRVTIKDVAKEANVATSTVSRVLSNSPRISDETKKRVNEAIQKLNYNPNIIARSLANNKTKIIGVVIPSESQDLLTNHFFIKAMKGMSECAQKKNYYITYVFSSENKSEIEHIKDITKSNLVDGVILLRAKESDEIIEYLKSINFPFSIIGRPHSLKDILWVDNDNFKAMYDLINKLIHNGHEKIGFIGAIKEWNMSKDRLEGYKIALKENGIKYNENLVKHENEFTEENGYIATNTIMQQDVSAIVTTDDLLAFGTLKYLEEKNINNISIAGFNNTPLSEYQNPKLASIDINADILGYSATNILINNLEKNKDVEKFCIVETKFIERESFL
ncbi:MAG: LacI family DNA-binding transcriptional regulator [Peptostreptococcaceae bacterium]